MDKKLDLILQKLESVDEVKQIVLALREGQEVTNAKLDALSMDVHKLNGELSAVKEQTISNTEQYDSLSLKVEEIETDLKILKKAFTS